ncbi:deoxynucleoside kinase [Streptomyces sp. NBC_00996]|uniref:deoxynucleoside kinase n=1 Tax=Streptomyces sp. NBC_00996 TaxID=2903710 RepID=UPI00386EF6CA|nr:deoxynucleoside kinase [Streptomyces sp. NBC_00996]
MRAEAHSRVGPVLPASCNFYPLGVVGLPGTGKSTVLEALTEISPDLSYIGTRAFHAPGSRMADYIHRLFVEADPRAALPCQFEALTERTLMQWLADGTALVDEPIEAVLAHTRALWACGLLSDTEASTWLTAYEIASRTLPAAALLVLLTCDREERQRRTRLRGRLRDTSVDDVYLDAFDEALHGMLRAAKCHGVVTLELDTTRRSPRASAVLLRRLL